MQWSELFGKDNKPTDEQIEEFVESPLWSDLAAYLQQTYNVKPKTEYSSCNMDKGIWKGWNVKYKKGGKSMCTLYPNQGYFVSLITISEKDIAEADIIAPLCTDYVKELYYQTKVGKNYGKMLGLDVTGEEILNDMKEFMALRVRK